jgi:hypothetical protein
MKKILFCLCILIFNFNVYAQDLNETFEISNYKPCNNSITLTNANNIQSGDLVLIIQMNGAIIDRSNTEKYGDIIDFNGAGKFEFNEVTRVNGNEIQFKYKIQEGYDFSAAVQIIKVERNKNLTITQNPNVKAWDGKTGGVLVLYAEDTLTLETDIDLSGKGFRGGTYYNSNDVGANSQTKYSYSYNNDLAGNKGEGIAKIDDYFSAGKGKNANGGGGGNACNSGGGGGGNLSFGGKGGDPYKNLGWIGNENGLGGGLSNFAKCPIILGGGGGVGHGNNGFGVNGTNGGGIVVILSKYFKSNNKIIRSNGIDVKKIAGIEGSSGGGSGGSIYLDIIKVIDDLYIECNGGKGGDLNNRGTGNQLVDICHGPGGGGSGGTLYLKNESILIKSELYGGNSGKILEGLQSCIGTSYGAMDGELGKRLLFNCEIPTQIEFISPKFYFELLTSGSCKETNNFLKIVKPIEFEISQIKWSNNEKDSIIKITQIGEYRVEIIDINGCSHYLDTNITDLNTKSNYDYTEVFTNDKFVLSGLPEKLPKGILLTENKSNEIGAVWQIEKLNLTKDFTTCFGFRVYNGFNNFMFEKSYPGADGFALIFQNNKPNPIGNNGGGIGYTGISNSLAIELDLFGNYLNMDSIFDPNGNHLAIFSNKTKPNISNHKSDALIKEKLDIIEILGDSSVYFFNVDYINKKMRVSISKDSLDFSNSLEIENFDFSDYISLDQNEYSYIGISSATGTAVQTHEVLNWSLCGDTKFLNTSIQDEIELGEILFYPNPVNDILKFNPKSEIKSVKIIDFLGKIVLETNTNEKINEINLEELTSGIYFIELGTKNNQLFCKFVKK